MSNDLQLFDRPVQEYLEDGSAIKVMTSAEHVPLLVDTPHISTVLRTAHESVVKSLQAAFTKWERSRSADQEEAIRQELIERLDEIAQIVLSKLSTEERELIHAEQLRQAGYGYVLIDKNALGLDEGQEAQWADFQDRANLLVVNMLRDERSRVQIRNPQAYFAYLLASDVAATQQVRRRLGREFFDTVLSDEQQSRLKAAGFGQI